jgi:hypothetical protein
VKKNQLLDLIGRVSDLTHIREPIIVGSHSLFAITDRVPTIVAQSIEADFLLAEGGRAAISKVNDELGVTSDFYDANGYYADGLGLATVVLVPGWKDRLQPLTDEQGQIVARCLEPHDAAVSKLMAGREKDFSFILALLDQQLISLETLIERAALIQKTPSARALLPRLKKLLDHLRGHHTINDVTPLLDLIHRLAS